VEEIGGRPLGEELHLRDAGVGSLIGSLLMAMMSLGILIGAAVAGVWTVNQSWERKTVTRTRMEKEIVDNCQMGPWKEEKIELINV